MTLTCGSLCAGVGGMTLGFERAGFEEKWAVEIDPKCREVLRARFPNAKLYEDVADVGSHNLEPVDCVIVTSPCQDLSVAGRREGLDGDRSGVWWECHRVLYELSPEWVVFENVPGLLSSGVAEDGSKQRG